MLFRSEVDRRRAAERERAAELAAAGNLRRLWKPVARKHTIALFHAADEAELHEKILDTLPLRPWMTVRVSALVAHPNDPGDVERG